MKGAIERWRCLSISDDTEGLDPLTFKQMTTRFIEWDKNGKLRVESKDAMKERGLKSPGRVDAVFGCIMCGSHLTGDITGDDDESGTSGGSDFAVGSVTGF